MFELINAREIAATIKAAIVEKGTMNLMEAGFYETSYAVYRGEDISYLTVQVFESETEDDKFDVILQHSVTNKNGLVISEKSLPVIPTNARRMNDINALIANG